MFSKEFQIFKTTFITQFWMTASSVWAWIDNFTYQILTPQYFIFKIKLKLKAYLNLLRRVRCSITCWVERSIISSGFAQNMIILP